MVAVRNLLMGKSDCVEHNMDTDTRRAHLNMTQPQLSLPSGAFSCRTGSDPLRIDMPVWSEQRHFVEAPSPLQDADPFTSGFAAAHFEEEASAVDMGFVSPFVPRWPNDVVRFPPGLDPLPGTPSHGSLLHGQGICKPCAWFWKSGGCKNGQFCTHCHLCSEGELKSRKKTKVTMMRLGLVTPKAGMNPNAMASPPGFGFGPEPRRVSTSCSESETTAGGYSDHDLAAALSSEDDMPFSKARSLPVGGDDSLLTPATGFSSPPPGLQRRCQPSEGSAFHGTGACQPCAWFWKPGSCLFGEVCKYCHLCPEDEIKSRRKLKVAALRLRKDTPTPNASLDPKIGM